MFLFPILSSATSLSLFAATIFSGHAFSPRENFSAAAGLLQTAMYAVRVELAYLVILAVMSFNTGVFLVAVAGRHNVNFFFFGSWAFKKRVVAGGKRLTFR